MYYEVQVVELICIMEDDQEFRIFYDDETELDVGILTPLKLGDLNPDFSNEAVKKHIIETCRQAEKEGISYGKMVQRRYL